MMPNEPKRSFSVLLPVVLVSWLGAILPGCAGVTLKDVSSSSGLSNIKGYVAAVADINGDHFADLLVVEGSDCTVLVWNDGHFAKMVTVHSTGTIHSVLPADYDGDGKVDVLICTQSQQAVKEEGFYGETMYSLHVHWGTNMTGSPKLVAESALAPPALLDVNLDLLPDIVIPMAGQVIVYCSSTRHSFEDCSSQLATSTDHPVDRTPALIYSDDTPVISSLSYNDSTNSILLSAWQATEIKQWMPITDSSNFLPAAEISLVGMETWQDMDLDGSLDLLVPVCWDAACHNSSILILFTHGESPFSAASMRMTSVNLWMMSPSLRLDSSTLLPGPESLLLPGIRCGDLDLDGFVDGVIVGVDMNNQKHTVFLHNEDCSSHCGNGVTRTLVPQVLDIGGHDAFVASFFDFKGDGIPDFLLSTRNASNSSVGILQQSNVERNAFVKVVVTSCVSTNTCVSWPGTAVVGTRVSYSMAQQRLNDVTSSNLPLLSQVGTMTLQMPSVIVGLGRPITYVRSMSVALPSFPGQQSLSHQWPAIIPNSKVLIVANPTDQPTKWEARLLLNAGQAVWQTALVFTCTCIVLALAFIFLHRREQKEDELERKEQSHQFHFDAL
ncbi:T-cell immunomodulatory protein-like isoform X1 [Sycon ciliatum]|uniref:T-cell immunomodulatory protein-like isoform X1 n=1 Tax=Sycon ciliatum TaxID=27933 RepID=UPI0031F7195D